MLPPKRKDSYLSVLFFSQCVFARRFFVLVGVFLVVSFFIVGLDVNTNIKIHLKLYAYEVQNCVVVRKHRS